MLKPQKLLVSVQGSPELWGSQCPQQTARGGEQGRCSRAGEAGRVGARVSGCTITDMSTGVKTLYLGGAAGLGGGSRREDSSPSVNEDTLQVRSTSCCVHVGAQCKGLCPNEDEAQGPIPGRAGPGRLLSSVLGASLTKGGCDLVHRRLQIEVCPCRLHGENHPRVPHPHPGSAPALSPSAQARPAPS